MNKYAKPKESETVEENIDRLLNNAIERWKKTASKSDLVKFARVGKRAANSPLIKRYRNIKALVSLCKPILAREGFALVVRMEGASFEKSPFPCLDSTPDADKKYESEYPSSKTVYAVSIKVLKSGKQIACLLEKWNQGIDEYCHSLVYRYESKSKIRKIVPFKAKEVNEQLEAFLKVAHDASKEPGLRMPMCINHPDVMAYLTIHPNDFSTGHCRDCVQAELKRKDAIRDMESKEGWTGEG